jgi:FkbM family methyltransferase
MGRATQAAKKAGKLMRLLADRNLRRGLCRGVAAAIEHEACLRSLPVASVVDVGANNGQFSLLVRRLLPGVPIHAFEPLAGPATRYEALFGRDERIRLHRVAAGEAPAQVPMNVSQRVDSSSLLPISAIQERVFPGTGQAGVEIVEVRRGDDVLAAEALPRPCLIKLDVQGFELSALKGLQRTLERADYVYVEVSFVELYEGQALADEIVGWLARRGFALAGVYNLSVDERGVSIQADALFARRDGSGRANG